MEEPVALPPFTPDMRAAIRECRFKTTNVERSFAWVYDADRARIEATGMHFTAYRPAPRADPARYDYEARSADPRVIEYVALLT